MRLQTNIIFGLFDETRQVGSKTNVLAGVHLRGCHETKSGGIEVNRTHSMRSLASQRKDLMNNKNPNIRPKEVSNSSRKIVKASKDSVMKNHSLI